MWVECPTCGGLGWIQTCIDDLCQGENGCIHGDGDEVCPECEGHGEVVDHEEDE